MELGETIEAAAVRETFEETGLRAGLTPSWASTPATHTRMPTAM
jgi:8-oxo-dGTP pyrophosphatase MutT (NUDIX family)